MKAAVEALGFTSDQAENGPRALQMMKSTRYALVLLDILMPEMDGFEVMSFMQRDRQLRDIPVIVISALEGEMPSVVKAIEMGAEDFLPKRFDRVLLAARLDSALESKRAKDRELEQRRHVEKLTQAAAILENQIVNPDVLQLNETTERTDDIGKLARVFVQMTRRIHGRENQLNKQIQMIRTGSLLLGIGVVGGSCFALATEAIQQQPNPLGIVLWVNLFCACICLPIAAFRQPIRKPTGLTLISILLLGVFTLLLEVPVFWAAQTLSASIIVMFMAIESMLIGILILATRAQSWSLSRFNSMLFGTAGIVVAFAGAKTAFSTDQIIAVAVLSIAPLAVAVRTLYWHKSTHQPMDTFALVGSTTMASALLIAPAAVYLGDLASLMPSSDSDLFILVVALLTVVTAATMAMRITLTRFSGPQLAIQAALATMVAGLVWSYLLHGELLPFWGWVTCVLLLIGGIQSTTSWHEQSVPAVHTIDVELG